jgi:hypothetical protein
MAANYTKPDEPLADRGKARKDGGQKRPKPKKHQRAVCSVCGAADGGLYRHTSPLALYCAKRVPTG